MNATLRTLCFIGAFGFAPAAAFAQQHATDQGAMQLSGSASFTSSGSDGGGDRTTVINLNPRFAYFIRPGLSIGAEVTLGRLSRGDNSSTVFGIGPAASYYFGGADSRTKPYLTGAVQWQKTSDESGSSEADRTSTGYGVGAGLLHLLSSSVGITTELFYRSTTVEFDFGDASSDTYGLAVGVAAFIF